jgi:nucleotide-binding universal stress UspA family protein
MYQRILVPYDGSPASTRGLDEAVQLAKLSGGSLRLIHVVDELSFATGFESSAVYLSELIPLMHKAGEAILENGRARAAAAGVPVQTLLFEDFGPRLSERVVEQAELWKAELIVIGTHGRRGVARLLMGSDAEQILRLSPVPVLLVRGAST